MTVGTVILLNAYVLVMMITGNVCYQLTLKKDVRQWRVVLDRSSTQTMYAITLSFIIFIYGL